MDKCQKCKDQGVVVDGAGRIIPCDCIWGTSPAPKAGEAVLHEAIAQLRALEAAGEDPRNANQRWDVTPEQAGALLAHLDDVEQKRAEVVAAQDDLKHPTNKYLFNYMLQRLGFDPTKPHYNWEVRKAFDAALAPAQEASDGK